MRQLLLDVNNQVLCESAVEWQTPVQFLTWAITQKQDFSGADLVKFVRQWPENLRSLAHMNFRGINLMECHAAGIDFQSCDFTLAILRGAHMRGCDFSHAVFGGTIMDAVNMHDCNLQFCEMIQVPQSGRARHYLRPHEDEFLPFDRVLARGADFSNCDFSNSLLTCVNFNAAMFEHAKLISCLIEKCDFTGAIFTGCDWNNSTVYRSELMSVTLSDSISDGAVFRSNEYIEFPVPKLIAEASFAFPQQLWGYIKEEVAQFKRMPATIKTDYTRVLLIRVLVIATAPMLAFLAWKYLETNAILSLITAVGAISTFALRRYFTMLLQGVFSYAFGKANDAEGLWKAGHRGKNLAKLLVSSMITHKLQDMKKEKKHETDSSHR